MKSCVCSVPYCQLCRKYTNRLSDLYQDKLLITSLQVALVFRFFRDSTDIIFQHPRPITVVNDCHMMRNLQRQIPHQRQDGRFHDVSHLEMQCKSAMHDHSYHKILSTDPGKRISPKFILLKLSSFTYTSSVLYDIYVKIIVSILFVVEVGALDCEKR